MADHGAGKYANEGCRCATCRKANTDRIARRRAQRHAWVARNGLPRSVQHGVSAYDNWGCRCDICVAAKAAKNRRYAKRQAS